MRRLTVAGAVCFAVVAALGCWFWRARPEPVTGATYKKPGLFSASAHLSVAQLVPQENKLTGTVSALVGATDEGGIADAKRYSGLANLLFQIEQESGSTVTILGETDKPMALQGFRFADGSFSWKIEPLRSAIMYPFDSYVARMRPVVLGERAQDPGAWIRIPVETVEADFSGVNFTTAYAHGSEDGAWFTLTLTRPLWLRVVTVVALALLGLWAVLFPLTSNLEPAGLLTLFAGLFGLRSSLLSGAPVFPSLIDYLSILLYMYVAAMLLIRRAYKRPERECRFCMSHVHPRATVCPACARSLAPPETSPANP